MAYPTYATTDEFLDKKGCQRLVSNMKTWVTGTALTGYATQTWVTNTALSGYATQTWVSQQSYATQTWVNQQITAALTGSYQKVNLTTYPTLQDFLASTGSEGYMYLYPINTSDLTKGYYNYIWENNAWLCLGTTQIDLSNYVQKTFTVNGKDWTNSNAIVIGISDIANLQTTLNSKVDTVAGKGLSTCDYTQADQTKVSNIEAGAQVNVIESIWINNAAVPIDSKSAHFQIRRNNSVVQWHTDSGLNVKYLNIGVPIDNAELDNTAGFYNKISIISDNDIDSMF